MNIGYLITKDHFKVKEVDFESLVKIQGVHNVFLEYNNDFKHFKRALYELNRLDINIGIKFIGTELDLIHMIYHIKGIDICLGIWFENDQLRNYFKNAILERQITGIISDNENVDFVPRWGINGDIENIEMTPIIYTEEPVMLLKLNTGFDVVYKINNLKPIPSTYDVYDK